MDEWIDQWSSEVADSGSAPTTRRKQASKDAIGSNPKRRYGSSRSRALSP